jgi:sugar phosphate permease
LLRDPPRGIQDRAEDPGKAAPSGPPRSSISREAWLTYGRLLRNKPYALTVLGYAAYTFAIGGLAYWMPSFLERARGIPRSEATVSFGTIVVITGFIGTFVGGWMGDYFAKNSRQAYLWLSAIATLIAAPFVWLALTTNSHSLYVTYMVTAQLCLFLSTGPINAAIINLVIASERATAIALSVFAIHLLGDALSPLIVGALSDAFSLQQAITILPVAVLVGGFVWIWAARAQAASGLIPEFSKM